MNLREASIIAEKGAKALTRYLRDQNWEINDRIAEGAGPGTSAGMTLLAWAAAGSHYDHLVRLLLELKADPTIPDDEGWTALTHARTTAMDRELLEALEERGRDWPLSNAERDLHWAADDMEPAGVARALADGADVNARDSDGETALIISQGPLGGNCDAEITKLLLEAGADPDLQNRRGETALHRAAWDESGTNCLDLMLKAGANPNLPDARGCTPLMNAFDYFNHEGAAVLIMAGADPDLKNTAGETGRSMCEIFLGGLDDIAARRLLDLMDRRRP